MFYTSCTSCSPGSASWTDRRPALRSRPPPSPRSWSRRWRGNPTPCASGSSTGPPHPHCTVRSPVCQVRRISTCSPVSSRARALHSTRCPAPPRPVGPRTPSQPTNNPSKLSQLCVLWSEVLHLYQQSTRALRPAVPRARSSVPPLCATSVWRASPSSSACSPGPQWLITAVCPVKPENCLCLDKALLASDHSAILAPLGNCGPATAGLPSPRKTHELP